MRVSYRTIAPGQYYIQIDGTPGARIDALLQELILSRGLYYYSCSLARRGEVVNRVVRPIFQRLSDSRFERTYPRLLRKQILGKSLDVFVPGDFYDPSAHKYEVLFRKWDIKLITHYDFVRDPDDLLTSFMLEGLGFVPGQRSPRFDQLVDSCLKENIIFTKETGKAFKRVHALRTHGLHRLERNLPDGDVGNLALEIYLYFKYFEEFQASQKERTVKLNGKWYRRIKYGDEEWDRGDAEPLEWSKFTAEHPCHDCAAIKGQYHCFGCDVERCPRCLKQALGCGCERDYDLEREDQQRVGNRERHTN